MPDGYLHHRSCIHLHDSHLDSSEFSSLGECPFPRRAPNITQLGYYSDWSVYAQIPEPKGYSSMSSTWTVPAKPTKRGPAGQSAVYLFNGLEDGGGHHGAASLILQPVLQFGKSGCLLDPLLWDDWHFSAYLVDGNGRAHCGPRMKVNAGQTLVGNMTLTEASTNTWTVTASVADTKQVSSYSASIGNATIDAAYLTLEGMVIYNCAAYPPGGGTRFFSNVLIDKSGQPLQDLEWTPEVRHSECAQAVTANDGTVTLQYDSSK